MTTSERRFAGVRSTCDSFAIRLAVLECRSSNYLTQSLLASQISFRISYQRRRAFRIALRLDSFMIEIAEDKKLIPDTFDILIRWLHIIDSCRLKSRNRNGPEVSRKIVV